jgi:arylformamidase
MTSYGGYDRAGLDAQYNLRARHADAQVYIDRYTARSAETRTHLKCRLDVAYGPSEPERLDIFPAARANAAVQVFIHGGYWQALDCRDFDFIAEGFVPQGAATVVVNYALAPNAGMDEIVRQNRAALAWVWRNARSFGGDPARIFVSGHSAGGHMTAMMATTDWRAFDPALPRDLVKGGCAISGIYELEPIRLCYLNDKLQMNAAVAAHNSPIRHLPAVAPPLILCVGAEETAEFLRQQQAFAAAWTASGHALEIVSAPGLQHFSVVEELARPGSPLNRAVCRQMGIAK